MLIAWGIRSFTRQYCTDVESRDAVPVLTETIVTGASATSFAEPIPVALQALVIDSRASEALLQEGIKTRK